MIKGAVDSRKAKGMGAPLVDPNQQAMANATKRMLRANQTGTSTFNQKRMAAGDRKMMFRRSNMAGGRSLAPYLSMMRDADSNIQAGQSQERLGLLNSLVTQKQNVADRKMDLPEQAKQQKNIEAQANKQTGEKNFLASSSRLGDLLGGSDGGIDPEVGKSIMEALRKIKGLNIDDTEDNTEGGTN
jgi:hypothetical protein